MVLSNIDIQLAQCYNIDTERDKPPRKNEVSTMKMYNTNSLFDNKAFAELLNKNGVKAFEVEGGLMFDEIALKNMSKAEMPHWIYMNLKWMI